MAQKQTPPDLRPFNGASIPQQLKDQKRWAPWKAVWSEKRGKYDKIPCQAKAPFYGISTAKPERWYTYLETVQACQDNPTVFAGAGYVMTGAHGLVGVDLDRCVSGNVIADWALAIVSDLDSYVELSPSGNGLRAFVQGEIPDDWTNHEIGIEVYAGHEPRFLTVTGQKLKLCDGVVREAPDVLEALGTQYARERSTAVVISLTMPDLVDDLLLPDVASLDIPYAARDFLTEGTHRGDRSRELFATSVALYAAGLPDDQVFSLLVTSPHAFAVAMDHRRQDPDRALMFLWTEQCQKAKGRGTSRVAKWEDFEDVSTNTALAPVDIAQAASAPA